MNKEKINMARLRHAADRLHQDEFTGLDNGIDWKEVKSMSSGEFEALCRKRTTHQLEGLQVLNEDGPYGLFNKHTGEHIEDVNNTGEYLMEQAARLSGIPVSQDERKVLTGICFFHDIGNSVSRESHGQISAYLLTKRIFKNIDYNDPVFKSILLGIVLHNESEGIQIPSYEDLKGLYADPSLLTRSIAAAIAADKLDVGRHRTSTTLENGFSTHPQIVFRNVPHTVLSLFAENSWFELGEDGKKAVFKIDFASYSNPSDPPEKFKRYKYFLVKGSNDLMVPDEWEENWRKQIPYSVSYMSLMQQHYAERHSLLSGCLFSLYPTLEEFDIVVHDKRDFTGFQSVHSLQRENWEERMFTVWRNNHFKDYIEGNIKPPPLLARGEKQYLASRRQILFQE